LEREMSARRIVSLVLVVVAICAAFWLGYHDRHGDRQAPRASAAMNG
jgi:lipopolysaccharide export system protein LptC